MHGSHKWDGTPQTFCADLSELSFDMVEQENGCATVIRFRLPAENPRIGDILVVLDGQEIRFHGMIRSVDDKGWAIASDRRWSSIAARIK